MIFSPHMPQVDNYLDIPYIYLTNVGESEWTYLGLLYTTSNLCVRGLKLRKSQLCPKAAPGHFALLGIWSSRCMNGGWAPPMPLHSCIMCWWLWRCFLLFSALNPGAFVCFARDFTHTTFALFRVNDVPRCIFSIVWRAPGKCSLSGDRSASGPSPLPHVYWDESVFHRDTLVLHVTCAFAQSRWVHLSKDHSFI